MVPRIVRTSGAGASLTARFDAAGALPRLDPRHFGHEPAVLADLRVPGVEARLEVLEVVAALCEAHRLRGVGRHAELVPGDLPDDGHDHLSGDAGERHDRGLP